MKKVTVLLTILVGVAFSLSGCATTGQYQSGYQAGTTALGALTGQLLGRDTKSTLIGAGVGYVAGGLTKEWAYPRQETMVVQQQHYHHQPARRVNNPGPVWCPPKPLCVGLRYAESPYERARQRQKCRVKMRDWRQ